MPQAHGVVHEYLLAYWDVTPLIRLALHEEARKNTYIIKETNKKKDTLQQQAANSHKRGCRESAEDLAAHVTCLVKLLIRVEFSRDVFILGREDHRSPLLQLRCTVHKQPLRRHSQRGRHNRHCDLLRVCGKCADTNRYRCVHVRSWQGAGISGIL